MSDGGEDATEAMDDAELATILDHLNRTAIGHLSDEVTVDQDSALDRYFGKPTGDEEEGLSRAISMDIAEVVDWALPDLLEPFISGDKAVEFEAASAQDDAWVSQADDLANHVFYKDNDGVTFLYDTLKTALIQKIGYSKTYWKDNESTKRETLGGVSMAGLQQLQSDPSIHIISASPVPLDMSEVPQDAQSAFPDGMAYAVDLMRHVKDGKVCLLSVPPEEIKISSRAVNMADLDYVAHETEPTRSKLIEMGFDREVIESLTSERKSEQSRSDTRFTGETGRTDSPHLKMFETVLLIEEYPIIDIDGSGAKRWQIFRVGKTILSKQEVSEHPFDAWTADRIPHRLIGLALADKVKQTQAIKTSLVRDLLNNIYMANRPRFELPDGAANDYTQADLLNVRVGGLIRTKQPGMIQPILSPDRTGTSLTAITYMDSVREQQSGITRNGMAISSEAVDAKSATESRRQDRNEQTRKRLMCRMIAETFLVPVFRKVLRLLVAYQDAPKTVRVSGKWVEMSPRAWNADARATAAVGLGHANRDEEMAAAQIIMGAQEKALAIGMSTPQHFFKTAEKLVRAVGWRDASQYFVDPASPEGQQMMQARGEEKPDPKMQEMQARIQLEQARAQATEQRAQAELQARTRGAEIEAQMKHEIAALNADNDRRIAEMRIAAEAQIAHLKMEADREVGRQRAVTAGGAVG